MKNPFLFNIQEMGFSICKLIKLRSSSVSKFPVVLSVKCLDKLLLVDTVVTGTVVFLLHYHLSLSMELQWQEEAKSVKVLDRLKRLVWRQRQG